jgi:hypothetical protein
LARRLRLRERRRQRRAGRDHAPHRRQQKA